MTLRPIPLLLAGSLSAVTVHARDSFLLVAGRFTVTDPTGATPAKASIPTHSVDPR
jgi:hypothetical protein